MIHIPEEEIRKRLQKLYNYEKVLYPELKERSDKLREKNKILQEENDRLREENKQIEKLLLELEELKAMKFGKRREKSSEEAKIVPVVEDAEKEEAEKQKRSKESYRRKEPLPEEITDRLRMELSLCPECGEVLVEKKEYVHYREDLYTVEDLIKSAKKIVETIIESGECSKCGTRKYAMEVPKQKVIIGDNIRMMVVYLTVMQGQSYSEVQRSLKHQYGVDVSNGEVANILEGESNLLIPYYNYLVGVLEEEGQRDGNHYDETSWRTESRGEETSEGNYCWVKVGVKSENRLIWFGRSRGKGVAEKLRGEEKGSIGVSDDYGGYRYLFENHQLCWAHPHRKLRDLAESGSLIGKHKKACQMAYQLFADVYKKSRRVKERLVSEIWTEEQKKKERLKLEKLFEKLFEATTYDPEKLKTIRETLKERKDRYFTFFDFPSVPLDNNKAERAIRKIVIKRKKSLGCQSQKGANVLSILYSVVFSLIESNPTENFFTLYSQALDFEQEPLSE